MRSERFSTRCARPRTLLPSSHWSNWDIAIAAGFSVGFLLFVVSSSMLRAHGREAGEAARDRGPRLNWPQLVDESLTEVDADLRADMIDRLSVVRSAWSRGILQEAQRQERDPRIRAAIERALTASC